MSPRHHVAAAATALLLLMFSMSTAFAVSAANDPLTVRGCEYGDVYQFSAAGCAISLENHGSAPLVLLIVPVQPGNKADPARLTLQPHAHAQVATRVRTDNIAGDIAWTFRIEGAGKEPHFARAHGFIMSALDDARPRIDFGSVDAEKGSVMKSISLVSSLDPAVRATKILSEPHLVNARIGDGGKTVVAEIGADMPWGPFEEALRVAINAPMQKEVWVEVTGDVAGDIAPEKNPYWLGTIPWQQKRTVTVPLVDKRGRDFRIGTVTSTGFSAIYDSAECEPKRSGCRNLLIHLADSLPTGLFKAGLDVSFPDRNKHLTLDIWGILAGRSSPGQKPGIPPGMEKVELHNPEADSDGTPPPPMKVQPAPPGDGPLLKWVIANQGNVHGYQIFRGDSLQGPFKLMNPRIIPTLDNGRGSVKYQWRDTVAVRGQTYWYYIAVVYKSGDRRALSGPSKTVAK